MILFLLTWGLYAAVGPGEESFYHAAALERDGHPDQAAEVYRTITEGPFADDALGELGRLYEERLGDPLAAAETYEQLVHHFPDSRLAARARKRAETLRAAMGPGGRDAPAVAAMNAVLLDPTLPRAEGIARIEALLARTPDFPDAGRALVWLGGALVETGRRGDGLARLREARRRFPDGEAAGRAARIEGDLLLEAGDLDGAAAAYRALDPGGAAHGLERVATARFRARGVCAGWIVVALAAAAAVAVTRRRAGSFRPLVRPPMEALFFLPLAAVFVAAAATENPAMTRGVTGIIAGGLVTAWLSGAALDAARAGGLRIGAGRVAAHIATAAAAMAAVCYISIVKAGLADFLVETLRYGPDR